MFDNILMPGAWDNRWDDPYIPITEAGTIPDLEADLHTVSNSTAGIRVGPPPPSRPNVAPLPARNVRFISTPTTSFGLAPPMPWSHPHTNPHPISKAALSVDELGSSNYDFIGEVSNRDGGGFVSGYEKKPIVIAVFGKTGTGKTSFIKAVTGQDLHVGHGLESCKPRHLKL